MSKNILCLDNQYQDIHDQLNNLPYDLSSLYKEHGEQLIQVQFLTALIHKIESTSEVISLLSITEFLFEFELQHKQPRELVGLIDGPDYCRGEVLYLSSNVLVVKISSTKFPILGFLLTLVKNPYFNFEKGPDRPLTYHVSAVSL
ncbi:hypothetical protein BCU70_12085 [Vibrio sp. 10N.286.49.C2]|uniref:hypothetical protein n=1 Tax=unclassified Vibrio TaxID=2614977 RepID=UPI000C822380|nr:MULTISPECIES: hypothetical protein [unclassified Vibrio]PMH40079.1 hypothetical protein BCU70_12085 [Vibrio sp. 10N.286.49.C2]PMH52146.1 hypothetical protein BCU66_16170 [Vibrio sp. 10N.286.49.B1]PMH78980.1 hypothetical protein BCU58_07065 [Vibrio sp. 10N.286.48.B7]